MLDIKYILENQEQVESKLLSMGEKIDFLRVFQKASYLNCGPLRKFFEDRLKAGQLNFVIDFGKPYLLMKDS